MSDTNDFAGRLRELRKAAGLTQGELAERAGMHRHGITKLELGERQHPSWDTVQALARALGVSTEAFVVKEKPAAPRGRPRKVAETAPAPRRRGKK
jgi:transcriptional regulator with XRE-family HTH domain